MATSSFTKNFKVQKSESDKFIEVMTAKNTTPKKFDSLQSKATTVKARRDSLKRALGK